MKWRTKKEIQKTELDKVFDYIDKDLLLSRICYELNIEKDKLYSYIDEEELKRLLCTILINRDINTKEKIDNLFNNIDECITDPHKLINANTATDIIEKYLRMDNSSIYIYGDYDVDGVISLFILTGVLQRLTTNKVIPIVPERINGYGLSMNFCESLVNSKNENDNILVLTVDNGITKKDEVKLLTDNNIEVIITDHHPSIEGQVPDCLVVDAHNSSINQDDTFKHLCGSGIAFKISQLVNERFNIFDMLNYTPYLAIATLADVMPLNNENMALIQYGLEIINSENCPKGILELKRVCGIDILTSTDILWSIAPMINACGRLGNTALASKLFFENDNAADIAKEIKSLNEKRKEITKEAVKEIKQMNFDDNKVCIIPTVKYPAGILGIIAGKVREEFNKPALVASATNDGHYHGSIRSREDINMIPLLKDMKDIGIIVDYGGHPGACVCTFDIDKIDEMNSYFNKNIMIEDSLLEVFSEEDRILDIDEEITIDHLNEVIYSIVNILPYDNRTYKNPVFALTDLKVVGYKLSKNNPNNIKFTLKEGKKKIEIWAWGFADKYINELGCPDTIHIAGEITKSFMGSYYTFNVIDIMA